MKSKIAQKPYWEMNADQLADATKEFDTEFVADSFHPMNAEDRARWEQARRKPSRVSQGSKLKTISISVEKALLERSDGLAKKKGLTRDALIDRALKTVLAADGQTV